MSTFFNRGALPPDEPLFFAKKDFTDSLRRINVMT